MYIFQDTLYSVYSYANNDPFCLPLQQFFKINVTANCHAIEDEKNLQNKE